MEKCLYKIFNLEQMLGRMKDRNDLSSSIKHLAAKAYLKRTIKNVSLQTVKEDLTIKVPQEEFEEQERR